MRYRITHTTHYSYHHPVAVCHNLVRLAPRTDGVQRCENYQLNILPAPTDLLERVDPFGNRVQYFSIQEAHRNLSLNSLCELDVTDRPAPQSGDAWEVVRDTLPSPTPDLLTPPLQHRYSSALIPVSDDFAAYARESFTPTRPIVDALREFTERVFNDFEYDPRATTVSTPVHEVFHSRAGVCQDFAHVAIACLRSIGLAARYVSGYLRTLPPPGMPRLVGVDASHAWLSLFCGAQGWIDADPTNAILTNTNHVTVAVGRDYADVCPIQGVYVGGGEHVMSVSVDVAAVPVT